MTTLPQDVEADLKRRIFELEQRLDQAVAQRDEAIERQTATALVNFRLQNELRASLERQNASAEILRTIAGAPADADHSLQRIAEMTARLFGAPSVTIRLIDGDEWGRSIRFGHSAISIPTHVPEEERRMGADTLLSTVFRENRQIHIPDLDDVDPSIARWPVMAARAAGTRTVASTPLRREGKPIGAMVVYRDRLLPFTEHELALQQSFADQAVIAIENARLFNETREALERQTATSDILRVIASSPADVQPVFDVIVERAVQLCGARMGRVYRYDGKLIHMVGGHGLSEPGRDSAQRPFPRRASDDTIVGRVMLSRRANILADLDADDTVPPLSRQMISSMGARSQVTMPMLFRGEPIGAITLSWTEPRGYNDQQIALLQTFADQAVIAIENVRLFNETRAALERQTATAEILKVIASSPADVQPVFDAIATSANRLLGGVSSTVILFIDGIAYLKAFTPTTPEADELLKSVFPRPIAEFPPAQMAQLGEISQIVDTEAAPDELRNTARARGFRSVIFAPLRNKDVLIGVIAVSRVQPGSFADHHVQLLQTFADQAVIAIENVRLFNETCEALERQTATADILKVIANSPSNIGPVFEAIAERSNKLMSGLSTAVYQLDNDVLHLMAFTRRNDIADAALTSLFPRPISDLPFFEKTRDGSPVQILDSEVEFADRPALLHLSRSRGFRSATLVPLVRDSTLLGVISVTRAEAGRISDDQVGLLQTFADQAVIAIENVRLFNETREALERQTATADILKVIASSPADVQPVFDAIVNSAARLFEPCAATITTLKEGVLHWNATAARLPGFDAGRARAIYPIPFDPKRSPSARAVLERRVIEIPDIEAPDTPEFTRNAAAVGGFRSITFVPLVDQDQGIGTIIFTHPQAGFKFSDKQLALVQTFADQAVIAIQNTQLFEEVQQRTRDLTESLQQQTATADVLKVIASSPTDVAPVLQAIAQSARELCDATDVSVLLRDGDVLRFRAHAGPIPIELDKWAINRNWVSGRAVSDKVTLQVEDLLATEDEFPDGAELARRMGHRTLLSVPMLRDDQAIGTIVLRRTEVRAFSDKQISLLQTFAAQAVIAIENTRLFNETKEALERQTATADILKVIASSPSDVQPVFEAIATSANRLLAGFSSTVILFIDGVAHLKAFTPTTPEADEILQSTFPRPVADVAAFRMTQSGDVAQIPDTEGSTYELGDVARARGYRSMLFVPLMNKGVSIGFIAVTRVQTGAFADHHIELLKTFADQAVIAIENTRLFEEVQARTRDLEESLQQQTATSEVLKVIGRSAFDLNQVFETVVESSVRLCAADRAIIFRFDGEVLRIANVFNAPQRLKEWMEQNPIRPGRYSVAARAALERRAVQVEDVRADPEHTYGAKEIEPFRTVLGVPMLKGDDLLGVIIVYHNEVKPFSDKQILLVSTFAEQAAIAIENVRLFEEVQAKTRDLSESLQQQTATADVLKVISRSAFDLQTVLDTLVESAAILCDAQECAILQPRDGAYRLAANWGLTPAKKEFLENFVFSPGKETTVGRVLLQGKTIHIHDTEADPDYVTFPGDPYPAPTRLGVPLLREGATIGVLVLTRREVCPFTEKQIELVQTFADQAVIAIENARLFNEVQARTQELSESLQFQTASAEVLKVISRSPDALQPVFDVIVETSRELCRAQASTIFTLRDGRFYVVAFAGVQTSLLQHMKDHPIALEQKGSALARSAREKRTVHIPNTAEDPEFAEGGIIGMGQPRANLTVPLMREGQVIGGISLRQTDVTPFTPRQIEAIETFADQAAIAIANVALFEQVQQRTRELTKSLDDLRTAQDRLIQTEKLASLGQLTAGIAHEIKNPLNFVNNFAALSAELTDELRDHLTSTMLADATRKEVNELTGLLKDNLQKVVQHGKRADSIVKNMLLHSREGSGEHRPADVNALVDESLNLAYHGARAEKPQFNVTLERDFDPAAGSADVFPQDITRVLLNLISNGFYAVTKRRAEIRAADFEPTVRATTLSRGDHVEIRIRDNGTGIPPDVREKMFNPFFTTKPAGEGTGLGLSMSHDIVVKQHGGTIEVDTEPGAFTEFRVVLPRASVQGKAGN